MKKKKEGNKKEREVEMERDGYKGQLDTISVGIGYVVQPTARNHPELWRHCSSELR